MVDEPVHINRQGATMVDEPELPPSRKVLACLRMRPHQGEEQVIVIHEFPFEIGREPELGAHHTVSESAARVSRTHLRLEKLQGGAVLVDNLAHGRSGTWANGEPMDKHFSITPVPATSKTGWHILGERTPGPYSVAFRLEKAA